MKALAALALGLALAGTAVAQQQHADQHFTPRVPHSAYASASGPVVAVDQAHGNFHRLDGRYAPFGKLLAADGSRRSRSPA